MTERTERARMAVCLGGGGITGATYQVGCLAALEEFFDGFSAAEFDVFVGSSSGATVATGLAGGFSATRLYRALLDPADDFFPLARHHLLRLDGQELRRVAMSLLGAGRHFMSSAASSPLSLDVWNELDRLWDSLPAGVFTLDAYEQFLISFMARRQIPERFDALARTLYLVAYDLDRGERVVFGRGQREDVPVAQAICASSATPILFAPVRVGEQDFIEGGVGEVAHADLALADGCEAVLIINPMVPMATDITEKGVPTGHGRRRRVRDKGLLYVFSQSFRVRSEAVLRRGLARYEASHPDARLLLLEPAPDDATMFMYSPMNFAARRAILEEAFRSTTRKLRLPDSPLRAQLERAGLRPR